MKQTKKELRPWVKLTLTFIGVIILAFVVLGDFGIALNDPTKSIKRGEVFTIDTPPAIVSLKDKTVQKTAENRYSYVVTVDGVEFTFTYVHNPHQGYVNVNYDKNSESGKILMSKFGEEDLRDVLIETHHLFKNVESW